jgi:hypothetical protein
VIPRSRSPVVRTGALALSISLLAALRLFGAFTSPDGLESLQTLGTLPGSAAFQAAAAESAVESASVVSGTDHVYHPGRLGAEDTVVPSTAIPLCGGEVTESCYSGELLRVQSGYLGRDAAEPNIGVDEEGVAFMTAAAYDAPLGLPRTRVMRSTDGGVSWSSVEPRLPGGDNPLHAVSSDPYLYVDEETGRVYWMDWHGDCSFLTWSDNQGASWTTNPEACGSPVTDHPTIVTGNPPPPLQTVGYPNIMYYCFNRVSDASCGRSLDGGLTWTPTGAPAFPGYEPGNSYNKFGVPGLCGGLHGHAVTDQAGRLYIPKSHCGIPVLAVSEDGGTTWRRTVVSDKFMTGDAHVGEHHSVSVDAAGNVYYLFWDDEEHLPWLAISKDAGRTFGEPMMIAPPGVHEVNLPAMVAGDAGKVAISFPGTTTDDLDDNRRPWDSYVIVTTDALADDPTFVATTANPASDPIHRGDCQGRCGLMLDFLDLVTSPKDGGVWAAVVDTCTTLNNCNRATSPGNASDGEGVAVRQVGGPRILSTPAS